MHPSELPPETALDLRARAELALAFPAGDPPAHLFRHAPWHARRGVRRVLAALLVGGGAASAVFAMRPPELVRAALEHEYHERTLRGSFLADSEMARHLDLPTGRPLPGYTQLVRPCDIDGTRAYHLTTFFERGGLVTVMAFEQPPQLADGQGWWGNTYWKVTRSQQGRPLLFIAQKKQAIAVASQVLAAAPAH